MKRFKKATSIFLAISVIVTLMSATVSAGNSGKPSIGYNWVLVGNADWTDEETASMKVGDGTISWDSKTATLTLDNADMSKMGPAYPNYIRIEPDTNREVTIKLKGTNTIGTEEHPSTGSASIAVTPYKVSEGNFINSSLKIEAEENAVLNAYAIYDGDEEDVGMEAIFADGTVSISGGTYHLAANYSAIYSGDKLTINNGANIIGKSTANSGIFSRGGMDISGKNTSITMDSQWCALLNKNNGHINISNGASVKGTTKADHPIYINSGDVTISDATLNLSSELATATGIFDDLSSTGKINIDNSDITIHTDSTNIYAPGDITVNNSKLNLTSGANPIYTKSALTIDGKETKISSKASSPIASDDKLTIKNGTIHAESSNGSTLFGAKGITISGGDIYTKTSKTEPKGTSSIYTSEGDITIEGKATKVEAISTGDCAIFARNGKVNLMTDNIKAIGGTGMAAITARQYSDNKTAQASDNILLDKNLQAKGGFCTTSEWTEKSDHSGYYADSYFVKNGTNLPATEAKDALQTVEIIYKDADYSKVDAAIKKVPSDLSLYTDASVKVLNDALKSVVRGKNITEQAVVDGYAAAIEKAISSLEKKSIVTPPVVTPSAVTPATKKITAAKSSTRKIKVSWKKKKGAKGYIIYAKKGNGKYKKLTTAKAVSAKTVSVKSGYSYNFKVRPYKYMTKNKKTVRKYYKSYQAKKKEISKTVKITYKSVSGYQGYVVYQKAGKKSYKAVLTTKKGGTITYTNKKGKVGTSYDYQVKGYKTVNGKKVYTTLKTVKA